MTNKQRVFCKDCRWYHSGLDNEMQPYSLCTYPLLNDKNAHCDCSDYEAKEGDDG